MSDRQRDPHARSRQFFFVLEGTLTLEVDGRVHQLGPGVGLEVAPGAVVSQPPSHGDRHQ